MTLSPLDQDLSVFYCSAGSAILFKRFTKTFKVFGFTRKSQDGRNCFSAPVALIKDDPQPLFGRWEGFPVTHAFILKSKVWIRTEYKTVFVWCILFRHTFQCLPV